MKRNLFRICLDILMLVILSLLFTPDKFPLGLHQIGGIMLLALFINHCLLNRRALAGFLTSRRMRLLLLLDGLLALAFSTLIASGLSISIFPFASRALADPIGLAVHAKAGAMVLLLLGVHLGLHWNFILGMAKKYLTLPLKVTVTLSVFLLAFFYILGTYNIAGGMLPHLVAPAFHPDPGGFAILNPLSVLVVIASLSAFIDHVWKQKGKRGNSKKSHDNLKTMQIQG